MQKEVVMGVVVIAKTPCMLFTVQDFHMEANKHECLSTHRAPQKVFLARDGKL